MPSKRTMVLEFPAGGIDRGTSFQRQPPYTTPYAVNVRPRAAIQQRARGGSRPMLKKHCEDQLGTATYRPIRMIATANTATSISAKSWAQEWNENDASGVFSAGGWTVNSAGYFDTRAYLDHVRNDPSYSSGIAYHPKPADLDTSKAYSFSTSEHRHSHTAEWVPAGFTVLYAGLASYASIAAGNYVSARFTFFYGGTANSVQIILDHRVAGVSQATFPKTTTTTYTISFTPFPDPTMALNIDGTAVSVDFNGVSSVLSGTLGGALSNHGFGFQLDGASTSGGGYSGVGQQIGPFTMDYYVLSYLASTTKSVYSAGGLVYIENPETGALTSATEAWTGAGYFAVSPLHPIRAVEMFGKLYIADYSTPRASGSDGVFSGAPVTTFDSATYSAPNTEWDAIGTAADDTAIIPNGDVLIVTGSGTTPSNDGVYLITTVAAGTLTVSPAAPGGAEIGLNFNIVRSPKVLDLADETLSVWRTVTPSTDGWVPAGCPLIARFGGRIYLAGEANAPHVWYACRMGVPLDFDYAETDAKRAIAGTSTAEGVIADAITALCPINEDIMCMATEGSMFSMRGNLADGGEIINLSYEVGCIGADVWATTPEGILIFMSRIGLYIVDPTSGAFQSYNAQPFSRRKLPEDLVGIKDSDFWATMAYDGQDEGIHLYLSPRGGGIGTHWFFDWQNKSPFMVLLNAEQQPCVIGLSRDGLLLIGGIDGRLRKYDSGALTDDGTVVTSGVFLGPFAIAGPGRSGCLETIRAVMGEGSADVIWAVVVGNTAEEAYSGDAFSSGTFVAGPNYAERPRAGGAAAYMLLASAGRWAMESLELDISDAGRMRLL